MIKSKCCNAEVETGGMGDFEEHDVVTCYHQCTSCKTPCDVVDPDRPAFHTDIQRLEEKVDKLGEMVAILLNDKVDKVEDDCAPNFWANKFK